MARVALVTGGTRGIGAAISLALKAQGRKVIANYASNDEAAAAFSKEHDIPVVKFNVSYFEECEAGIAKAVAEHGPIEILVNNAGITRDGLMMAMKRGDWDDVLATNLTGAFLLTQALLRPMLKNRWGRIVNISSVVGRTGQSGQVNYAASKAGLIGLTRSLAREVASWGITVNAVAPGYIETPMTAVLDEKLRTAMLATIPLGRPGTDLEIAQSVAFLASDSAAYITGHVLGSGKLSAVGASFRSPRSPKSTSSKCWTKS